MGLPGIGMGWVECSHGMRDSTSKAFSLPNPTMLKDPLTLEDIRDPVLASDGHTYEWASLREWVAQTPHRTSPLTLEVLRPLVYVNKAACQAAGLPPRPPLCRRLYSLLPAPTVDIPLDGKAAHVPWIVCLLTRLGWRRARLSLRVPAVKGRDPQRGWTVLGPPVAYPWRRRLEEWVADFGLGSFFANPECLATAELRVDGVCVATLEQVCGLEDEGG